jgi:hypothetical protein
VSCFKVKPRAGKAFMLSRVRWAWARSCRSKSKFVGSAPRVGCNWCAAEKGDAYARLLSPSPSSKVPWSLGLEKTFARGVPRSPSFVRTGPVGESSRGLSGEEGGGARPVCPAPAGKKISRGVPLKGCLELSSCSSGWSGEDGLLGDTYEMRTRGSLEEASCPCCSMDRANEEVEPRSACSVPEIGGRVLSSCLASWNTPVAAFCADEFNGEVRLALALGSVTL